VLYYNVNFAFLLVDHAAARYKSLREKYRREKLIVSREYKQSMTSKLDHEKVHAALKVQILHIPFLKLAKS
jgi:hypothetical protein